MKFLSSFFIAAIAAICFATHAQAQIIYQDSFSGSVADDLGTRTPDVSLNGDAWITAFNRANGGSDNNAAQVFNADGTIEKDGPSSSHDAGALLPLSLIHI